MTIVEATRSVVGGIDTHGEVHVAAALDEVGGLLGAESFSADASGYEALVRWLEGFGSVAMVGVEGTGSYGAGISRFLARSGIVVIEVDRQNRQARRRAGKSDPLDALEAARAALSGKASGQAKSRDGWVEALRVLLVAKRSARSARVKALTQMRQVVYSAPESYAAPSKAFLSVLSWPRRTACGHRAQPIPSLRPRRHPCRRSAIGWTITRLRSNGSTT